MIKTLKISWPPTGGQINYLVCEGSSLEIELIGCLCKFTFQVEFLSCVKSRSQNFIFEILETGWPDLDRNPGKPRSAPAGIVRSVISSAGSVK